MAQKERNEEIKAEIYSHKAEKVSITPCIFFLFSFSLRGQGIG
jgi:hypothetical protein